MNAAIIIILQDNAENYEHIEVKKDELKSYKFFYILYTIEKEY